MLKNWGPRPPAIIVKTPVATYGFQSNQQLGGALQAQMIHHPSMSDCVLQVHHFHGAAASPALIASIAFFAEPAGVLGASAAGALAPIAA